MTIEEVSLNKFFEEAKKIKYRNQDVREAFELGCMQGVVQCFENADHFAAQYFIGYENHQPKVAFIIQRDGFLVYFIDSNIEEKLSLVKAMMKKAEEVISRCGALRVQIANWYDEAIRFVRLIGFKPYKIKDKFTIYYKD